MLYKLVVKYLCLTRGGQLVLYDLSKAEGGGISGVAVKCVDIGRNIDGEGSHLATD